MNIDDGDIRRVAYLARLSLEKTEIPRYRRELAGILAFVEQINAVDTAAVEPMAHPLDMVQRLRADVITEPDRRAELQQSAPSVENGLYLVPKVIK